MENNSNNNNYDSEPTFDKFCQEAHEYFNDLSQELGHPNEEKRVVMAWKAVMHTIRDRIHISESLDLISSLPIVLKGMYVHNWQYHEKPPLDFEDIEGMKNSVKRLQDQYGEVEFDWGKSTENIISVTLNSLQRYISDGSLEHVKGQMPKEIQDVFQES